jgi:hypothetical protein
MPMFYCFLALLFSLQVSAREICDVYVCMLFNLLKNSVYG